jgi:G3E family GTPase
MSCWISWPPARPVPVPDPGPGAPGCYNHDVPVPPDAVPQAVPGPAPLLAVTGFLGAGKTTFLRALVPALARRGLRPRVVLNDFKDARIDAATLADLVPDLVALSGSCVCCESLDDLLKTLGEMSIAAGDVVVLEANGGTESGELLALLASAGHRHLTAPLQLAVVDVQRFGRRGWQDQMEEEQLATATQLFLSRTDQVTADRAAQVQAAAAAVAPAAGWTTPDRLADILAKLCRHAPPAADGNPDHDHEGQDHDQDHDHDGHQHNVHRHPFAAHLVELPFPVDAQAFTNCLASLPPEVLRAKGIVLLRDPPGEKRSFQKVETDVEISPCQLADPEQHAPRAVFIGPRLPVEVIEARLRALRD